MKSKTIICSLKEFDKRFENWEKEVDEEFHNMETTIISCMKSVYQVAMLLMTTFKS